jgi:hypothetical protein
MKGQWREAYYKKEWTKSVDISILYQMQMAVDNVYQMVKGKGRLTKKSVERELEALTKCLAAARGDVVNFDLSKLQMPEQKPEEV